MSEARFDLARNREGPSVYMFVDPSETDTAVSFNCTLIGGGLHLFFSVDEARQLSRFFAAATKQGEPA